MQIDRVNNQKVYSLFLKFVVSNQKYRYLVLCDADRTLSKTDTSKDYLSKIGLDSENISDVFRRYSYSDQAFSDIKDIYSNSNRDDHYSSCVHASNVFDPNTDVVQALREHELNGALIVIVTAGIYGIWNKILPKLGFKYYLIGGGTHYENDYYVSRLTKMYIAKIAKNHFDTVVAFGDSLLDLEMLIEADIGVVIANERHNKTLVTVENQLENCFLYEGAFTSLLKINMVRDLGVSELGTKFTF